MLLVVGLHGSLKSLDRTVDFLVYRYINLGRCCPEHNDALNACLGLEAADILADLLGHVPAVLDGLHVVAVETLCVIVVESSLHGLDGLKFLADGIDVLLLENLGVDSRLVGVSRINVPCAEHDVVQVSKRNDVLVMEIFLVRATADTDLVILRHRAHRLRKTLACHEDSGHECRCDCTESHHQNAKFALGRFCFFCRHSLECVVFFDLICLSRLRASPGDTQ